MSMLYLCIVKIKRDFLQPLGVTKFSLKGNKNKNQTPLLSPPRGEDGTPLLGRGRGRFNLSINQFINPTVNGKP